MAIMVCIRTICISSNNVDDYDPSRGQHSDTRAINKECGARKQSKHIRNLNKREIERARNVTVLSEQRPLRGVSGSGRVLNSIDEWSRNTHGDIQVAGMWVVDCTIRNAKG